MSYILSNLFPLRIVVADSCPHYVDSLAKWLAYWGHETQAVKECDAAFEALRFSSPDMLMIEMESPATAAIKLILTLRAERPSRTLLIVAMTTDAHGPIRRSAIAAGADYVLSKPTNPDELLRILTRRQFYLSHAHARDDMRQPWLGVQIQTTLW